MNILNKQSQRDDKGWCSSLGLGMGVTAAHLKRKACYEILHRANVLRSPEMSPRSRFSLQNLLGTKWSIHVIHPSRLILNLGFLIAFGEE